MIHEWRLPDIWHLGPFILLLASAATLWVRPPVWGLCFAAATVLAYLNNVIDLFAILWIVVLAMSCWVARNTNRDVVTRRIATVGLSVLAVVLGMHLLPGFQKLVLVKDVVLSPAAAAYSINLHFDKAMVGVLLVGIYLQPLNQKKLTEVGVLSQGLVLIAANVTLLIACSYILGYLVFDPKWTHLFWIWAPINLLFTCLSEEAFFRGFLQTKLRGTLQAWRHGKWWALLLSALLFGVAHAAGGWRYVVLATIAGAGYGYIYERTRRIEMAIAAHFLMNALHFVFFTYPRLA